jgi:hypothetical protein
MRRNSGSGHSHPDSLALVCIDQVANCGDSRAVLYTDEEPKIRALSHDHKPYLEAERARIVSAGGMVLAGRVDGEWTGPGLGRCGERKDATSTILWPWVGEA